MKTDLTAQVEIYKTKGGFASGYSVEICKPDGTGVETYTAGGNPLDSGQPGESPLSDVRKWAKQTAKDMLIEKGLTPRGRVFVDYL